MKRNPTNRLKDPFYASLIFQIEQLICMTLDEGEEAGIELTDSHIRSTLVKARNLVRGAASELPSASTRDEILFVLAMRIYHRPDQIVEEIKHPDGSTEERELRIPDWLKAIDSVIHSIETHRSQQPGARNYVRFIKGFIAEASKSK